MKELEEFASTLPLSTTPFKTVRDHCHWPIWVSLTHFQL